MIGPIIHAHTRTFGQIRNNFALKLAETRDAGRLFAGGEHGFPLSRVLLARNP